MHHFMAAFARVSGSLRRRTPLLCAVLVFSTLVLYLPVVHHEFLKGWDDSRYITENTHVRSGLTFVNVISAFTTLEPFYWQPMALLSHMLDCQLFGLNYGAHHYVNVLLHAANALLLFLLLRQGTGSVWRSFLVAAFFALHPVNVETVAWAAERKSLLNAFFSLVTIAAYGWYAQRPNWKRYTAIVAAFLLALMSKPMAVTLPLILLLLDYWPLQRYEDIPFLKRWSRLLLEKLPLVLISAGISVITVIGERASDTVVPFSALPLSTRLENALLSYVSYIRTLLWPAGLSPFYPHPAMSLGPALPVGEVAAAALILAVITALVFFVHRKGFARMGWLFFLATLLPLIGIVQTGYQGRQDHFLYIPCIGFFILLVWGLAEVVEAASIPRIVPAAFSLLLLVGCSAVTFEYLQYWQNEVKLFERARSAARQQNPWLDMLYADALSDAGRADEALPYYQESCALGPRNEFCHFHIAEILFDRHQFPEAIDEYQLSLMFTRKKELALSALNKSAEALLQLGRYDDAQEMLNNALEIDPYSSTALQLREQLFNRRSK
jgi:tetratricopeptide (TPR) repeat protein